MIASAQSLQPPFFHTTHCALRLGDNLAHLHFLRKLAEAYPGHRFTHFCHADYFQQLQPVIYDQPRIALLPFPEIKFGRRWGAAPPDEFGSINAWKNAGGFWEVHPAKMEYAIFMVRWFEYLADLMGLRSPIKAGADLLFDYPTLKRPLPIDQDQEDHVLFVNSPPLSGQLPGISAGELDRLGLDLADSCRLVFTTAPLSEPRRNVICTEKLGYSITTIGRLSNYSRHIVMVATGPCWTTFNPWSAARVDTRVILCEENLSGIPAAGSSVTFNRIEPARRFLKTAGILNP